MTTQSFLLNFSSLRLFPIFCLVFFIFSLFFFSFCFDFASSCEYFFYFFCFVCFILFFCLFGLCYAIMWFFTYARFKLTSILSTQVLQAIVNCLTCNHSVELIGPKETCKRNIWFDWIWFDFPWISIPSSFSMLYSTIN